MLVAVDEQTSLKFATISNDRTSTNEMTISRIVEMLKSFGHHGPVELRSDGESSLMELLRHVAERRKAQTFLRRNAPHDSASN